MIKKRTRMRRQPAKASQRLTRAFAQASRLPKAQQDALAGVLVREMKSEHAWEKAFARSQRLLSELANEALSEDRAERTRELDPDAL